MNVLLFCFVMLLEAMLGVAPSTDLSKINKLKREARTALEEGRYREAAALYGILVDSMGLQEPALIVNRAHAYFSAGERDAALEQYQLLLNKSQAPHLRSMALNQIGLLSEEQVENQQLLGFFKQALKVDPSNEKARYNYQRVMQRIQDKEKKQSPEQEKHQNQQEKDPEQQNKNEQNQEQRDPQKNKDQSDKKKNKKQDEQQDQKNEEQSSQSEQSDKKSEEEKKEPNSNLQDKGEEKEDQQKQSLQQSSKQEEKKDGQLPASSSTAEKLRKMNLSEEKARQILEALRHNEIQYLQQLRRKATQPKDDSKPDW